MKNHLIHKNYLFIFTGCSVNGQCKPSGQTWTEECTKYTCDKGTTDVLEQRKYILKINSFNFHDYFV